MRNRLASLLRRWAYRIEGHRAQHRAGESYIYKEFDVRGVPATLWVTGSGGSGGRGVNRGQWNVT